MSDLNRDGFKLVTDGKWLELRSRPSTFLFSSLGAKLIVGAACLSSLPLLFRLNWWVYMAFVALVSLPMWLIFQATLHFFGIYEPQRWIFNRSNGFLCADKKQLAPLAEISHLQAFKFHSRLKLVVKLKSGQEFHLGAWRFCRSEHAWREDAAQIAAFLGVPLEISPAGS